MQLDRFQLGNLEDDEHFFAFSDGKQDEDFETLKADNYKDEDID